MVEESLVLWRTPERYECKGTVEQREAGKNVSLREGSRDPNPELHDDSSDTLKIKRKKRKERREGCLEKLTRIPTAKVAGSEEDDDKPSHVQSQASQQKEL